MNRLRRFLFAAFALTALAVAAGAQFAPGGPLAAEQLKMFRSNRELLENLVEHGVELANADTPVAKVKACRESAKDLGRALKDAVDRDDADRVAELGDHLAAVIRHGLLPTIDEARTTIPVGTDAAKDLADQTDLATQDARRFELSLPALGKVGASVKVKDLREKLRAAGDELTDRNRSR